MEKLCRIFVAAFLFMSLSYGVVYASTIDNYGGFWNILDTTPATDNAFLISWTFDSNITEFGVFYTNSSGTTEYLTLLNSNITATNILVDNDTVNGGYKITSSATNDSINIGSTENFQFYYVDNSEYQFIYDVTFENGYYIINLSSSTFVTAHDLSTVPIPPSALLLGSGVLGLIGFGVRRRRSNAS